MREKGQSSVKLAVRDLLLTADEEATERALRLAQAREAQR